MLSVALQKRLLLRWVGWFFVANMLLSLLIQATYLSTMPSLTAIYGATTAKITLAYFFLAVSYVAHVSLLNAAAASVVLLVAWFIPRKGVIFPFALLLSFVLIIAQVIDRVTYRLYHAHQFTIGITVLKSGAVTQVIPLSKLEYTALIVIIAAVILIEFFIAWRVWKRLTKHSHQKSKGIGYKVSAVLVGCICISYTLMAFVVTVPTHYRFDDVSSHMLLKMARLVSGYQIVYDWLVPGSSSNYRLWHAHDNRVTIQIAQPLKHLNYPLHPMQCQAPLHKPNIVFLVFDTLRYDSVTPTIMPNMFKFAKKTVQFDDAYSGGNCTQPGIFALFYGLPANYWDATVAERKAPVLMDQLNKAGYQMGIFASASLLFPQFADNVFTHVKNLRIETPGNSSKARDEKITQLFGQFLKKRNPHKPFFSFLFYDSVHNYCEGSSSEFMSPFKPAVADCARFLLTKHTNPIPYINRYHNAAYFLDQQAAKVLAMLKKQHLMNNTIIVVTADHGEQHNDQHMDYWSHESAYTPYQLHVPMMVYWPGIKPQRREYFATNMDVAPMLLQRVLNCKNPLRDYTVGESLFKKNKRPFLISGSYEGYAYVTQKQIIRIYPGGDYTINDPLGHHQYRASLNVALLKKAAQQLTRYYK